MNAVKGIEDELMQSEKVGKERRKIWTCSHRYSMFVSFPSSAGMDPESWLSKINLQKERKERQKTAHKLVQRQNRHRSVRQVARGNRSFALKDELQLRPKPANRQQEDRRADQSCDVIGHLQSAAIHESFGKNLAAVPHVSALNVSKVQPLTSAITPAISLTYAGSHRLPR